MPGTARPQESTMALEVVVELGRVADIAIDDGSRGTITTAIRVFVARKQANIDS